jgi:hypothetical protein
MNQTATPTMSVLLFDGDQPPWAPPGARRFEAIGTSVIPNLTSARYLVLQEPAGHAPAPAEAEVRVSDSFQELTSAVKDSGPSVGSSVLVVMLDIDPDHRDELEHGYGHHLAGRLRFPGFAAARLFKSRSGGSPEYLALYELTDPGAPTSKDYLSQPADPTNTLIRDHARLQVRQVYSQI